MQLSKFSAANLDIISLYRSNPGNLQEMNQLIKQLGNRNVPQIVVGDLNFHYLEEKNNSTKQFFKKEKYSQLIMEPTHTEGNLLDHAYVRDERKLLKSTAEVHAKYYTDHKGISLIVEQRKQTVQK